MYVIEDRNGKTKLWVSVIDEGYGPKPYIELSLGDGKKPLVLKVLIDEALSVASLLRHAADEVENNLAAIEAREGVRVSRDIAKSIWPGAQWIDGHGPYALVSLCADNVTVTLHLTEKEAHKAKSQIDESGCCGRCHGQHWIRMIGRKSPKNQDPKSTPIGKLPRLKCNVTSFEYDVKIRTGHIVFAEGECCDMAACIDFFKAIDPDVDLIITVSGSTNDTTYRRKGDDWEVS